jgi:hypothetical protein
MRTLHADAIRDKSRQIQTRETQTHKRDPHNITVADTHTLLGTANEEHIGTTFTTLLAGGYFSNNDRKPSQQTELFFTTTHRVNSIQSCHHRLRHAMSL